MSETVQEEDIEDIESLDGLDDEDNESGEDKPQALQQPTDDEDEETNQGDDDDGYEWEEIKSMDADALIEFDEEGKSFKSFYKGRDERGKGAAHFFEHMKSGATLMVWETTVLEDKLDGLAEGTPVKITYLGEKTSGSGQDYKDFRVERGRRQEDED